MDAVESGTAAVLKVNAKHSSHVKEEETAADEIVWLPSESEDLQQQPVQKGKGKAKAIDDDLDGAVAVYVVIFSCFYYYSTYDLMVLAALGIPSMYIMVKHVWSKRQPMVYCRIFLENLRPQSL